MLSTALLLLPAIDLHNLNTQQPKACFTCSKNGFCLIKICTHTSTSHKCILRTKSAF